MTKISNENIETVYGGVKLRGDILSVDHKGKNYTVTFKSGATVNFSEQNRNDALIEASIDNDGTLSKISLFNLKKAEVKGAPDIADDFYLYDCKKCMVDASEEYGQDRINFEYSNPLVKKTNSVKFSDGDVIEAEVQVKTDKLNLFQRQKFDLFGSGVVNEKEISN